MRWQASVVAVLIGAAPVSAQERAGGARAVAFDTVIGLQDVFANDGQSMTQVVVDGALTEEVSRGVRAVHSRASVVEAPAATGVGFSLRTYRAVDSTLGYLVNPEVTVRVGHSAMRSFTSPMLDHQIGVSLMWSRRWW